MNLPITIGLFVYFFLFNMVIPAIFSSNVEYQKIITYPTSMRFYSLWTIINFIITMFVLVNYAFGFIKNSIINYWEKR